MKKDQDKKQHFIKRFGAYFVLAGIILLAVFFRFYKLSSLPPGINFLEAVNGVLASQFLQNPSWQVYSNTGLGSSIESLFIIIQAVALSIIGKNIMALRVISALLGVSTVYVTYLWAKGWFGRRVGLIAAFFMAINSWVVVVNRTGVRANLTLFIIALVGWLLYKNYVTKKIIYSVLMGAVLVLGLWSNYQFVSIWLALGLMTVYVLLFRRDLIKIYKKNILIALATALIVAIPLGIGIVKGSAGTPLTGVNNKIILLDQDLSFGQKMTRLVENKTKYIMGIFSYGRGDQDPGHNVPAEPFLNLFTALMWLMGLVICLSKIKRLKYAVLVIILGATSLPVVLSTSGVPNGLLLLSTAPIMMIMSALGVNYMLTRWYQTFPVNNVARIIGAGLVVGLMILTAFQSYKAYFVAYAGEVSVWREFNEDISAIIAEAKSANRVGALIVAGMNESMIVKFLASDQSDIKAITQADLISLPVNNTKQTIYISAERVDSGRSLELVKAKFPNAKVTEHRSRFDDRLLFYTIESSK